MPKLSDFIINSKIRFKTFDGKEYDGFVKCVSYPKKRITLDSVQLLPDCKHLGTMSLFFHEFCFYEIFESLNDQNEHKANCLENRNKNSFTNSILGTKSKYSAASGELTFSDLILKFPPHLQSILPNDFVIIDECDSKFRQAVDYISQQSSIGVSIEGLKISHDSKVSWINIASDIHIFLFNIEALGKGIFGKGLRDIFQNEKISKVIHDFRKVSDCLFHMFSTKLINVFDVQIADFTINKQIGKDGASFKEKRTLDCCLENYLAVPKEFLYAQLNEKYYNTSDKWIINNGHFNVLIKNVVYLLLLENKLKERLVESAYEVTSDYLGAINGNSKSDLLLDSSRPNMIPPELAKQGLHIGCFQEIPASVTQSAKFKRKENISGKKGNISKDVLSSQLDDLRFDENNTQSKNEIEKKHAVRRVNYRKNPEISLNESRKNSSAHKNKNKICEKSDTHSKQKIYFVPAGMSC